jgi:hypothetical protein
MWVELISLSALMPASGQTVTDGQDMWNAASSGFSLSSDCSMHPIPQLSNRHVTATNGS